MTSRLPEGEVLLLENVRFYPGETAGDDRFAGELSSLCDVFVQDAFGTCHREHASVVGVPRHRVAAAGLLLKKELQYVDCLFESGESPFICILGGAKVSDKIPILENLAGKVDLFLIGGAMAYTFLAAQERSIGSSLVEENKILLAKRVLERCSERGATLYLPVDHVVAESSARYAARMSHLVLPSVLGTLVAPPKATLPVTCPSWKLTDNLWKKKYLEISGKFSKTSGKCLKHFWESSIRG